MGKKKEIIWEMNIKYKPLTGECIMKCTGIPTRGKAAKILEKGRREIWRSLRKGVGHIGIIDQTMVDRENKRKENEKYYLPKKEIINAG